MWRKASNAASGASARQAATTPLDTGGCGRNLLSAGASLQLRSRRLAARASGVRGTLLWKQVRRR